MRDPHDCQAGEIVAQQFSGEAKSRWKGKEREVEAPAENAPKEVTEPEKESVDDASCEAKSAPEELGCMMGDSKGKRREVLVCSVKWAITLVEAWRGMEVINCYGIGNAREAFCPCSVDWGGARKYN